MAFLVDANFSTRLRSLTRCRRRRAHTISSFQFIGLPKARRSQQPLTRRKHGALKRSSFGVTALLHLSSAHYGPRRSAAPAGDL